MYEILIEHKAEKDLNGLEEMIFNKITDVIIKLTDDPRPEGCRKLKGMDRIWRIRAGDYRVIYQIDDSKKEIKIERVRHRKDVYR